jgi:hypothetical protein
MFAVVSSRFYPPVDPIDDASNLLTAAEVEVFYQDTSRKQI